MDVPLRSFPLPINFPLLSRSREPPCRARVRVVLHIRLMAAPLSGLSDGHRPHSGGPPRWPLLPLPIERKQEREMKHKQASPLRAKQVHDSSKVRKAGARGRLGSWVHRHEKILIWMLATAQAPASLILLEK
jgi:hypothetical protein